MGQSLTELQNAVEEDFSKLLVSHGLFSSPYPFGSLLLCEVDTSNLSWVNDKLELVLQVLPRETEENELTVLQRLTSLRSKASLQPSSLESLVKAFRDFHCNSYELKDIILESNVQDCSRKINKLCRMVSHPNIIPFCGFFEGRKNVYIACPPAVYTLKSILHFSPNALGNDSRIRLLIYEILAGLAHCHSCGITHGNLKPSKVLLTNSLWCWITGFQGVKLSEIETRKIIKDDLDWRSQFKKWQKGELSNFDYLLLLNRLAGRRWGDRCFHTVMPWVIDFSVSPDETVDTGWRDLTKSKWHLAKGDEQLDFSYSTAEVPHHVSDECLSELAVCIYKARRLPLLILRRVVRSVYEPNEYPSNMQRLYQWTPDECIPEFYCDKSSFKSIHTGMSDLAVPHWANDAEDFIILHRGALESDRVSKQLHHWIDLTFGYKLTGEAAVSAKNVTLSTSSPLDPKSSGRRQLFFKPHPMRRKRNSQMTVRKIAIDSTVAPLEELEESNFFCESHRHLSPCYDMSESLSEEESHTGITMQPSNSTCHGACEAVLKDMVHSQENLLSCLQRIFSPEDIHEEILFDEFVAWKEEAMRCKMMSKYISSDIFAIGCLIAEIYLRNPLFDPISASAWSAAGVLPPAVCQLPPQVRILVEAALETDFRRRPTAKELLDSPFFSQTIRLAYRFLSPFHLLTSRNDRLHYTAQMAQQSVFLLMGSAAAELCAASCLSLLVPPYEELDPTSVTVLIKSLLQVLEQKVTQRLLVPVVQNLLQNNETTKVKSALLISSFMRNLRRVIGTSSYLQHIHTNILLNVLRSPNSQQGAAASAVLVDTCYELGLLVTLNQTIIPLIQSLGRDITVYGIETIVDIGERFGEPIVIKHWLPQLRAVVMLSGELSAIEKALPAQSWRLLAAVDAMAVLDRLALILSPSSVLTELLLEPNNIYVNILQQKILGTSLLQCAAKALIAICSRVGPGSTVVHVLPQLKQLFNDIVFGGRIDDNGASTVIAESNDQLHVVHILYPGLASVVGIERVRQCFPTWLLIEQILSAQFKWKWKETGAPQSRLTVDMCTDNGEAFSSVNILLNGVGWSIPQSQAENLKLANNKKSKQEDLSSRTPWHWVPSNHHGWGGVDSFSRIGAAHAITKDEQSWKLNSVMVHSWRAHSSLIRTAGLGEDECTMFTAGGGTKRRSVVKKWDLSTCKCVAEYTGHDELVNDLSMLCGFERVASCDGTLHIWNSETGKKVTVLDESTTAAVKGNLEGRKLASIDGDVSASNGILSPGNSYTSMHVMGSEGRVAVGTANGCMRFIDIVAEKELFSWRCEFSEASLSSCVTSITSSGSSEIPQDERSPDVSSWIAVGFNSGYCSLMDYRSGKIIAHWRAHGAAITKLVAVEEKYSFVSSSLDKTLSIWDLRRSWPLHPHIIHGHTSGITSFCVWGDNVLSAAGNKIGVSSFSSEDVRPTKIYTADHSSKNLSNITTISVLPFSHQFAIMTEDGYVKLCV